MLSGSNHAVPNTPPDLPRVSFSWQSTLRFGVLSTPSYAFHTGHASHSGRSSRIRITNGIRCSVYTLCVRSERCLSLPVRLGAGPRLRGLERLGGADGLSEVLFTPPFYQTYFEIPIGFSPSSGFHPANGPSCNMSRNSRSEVPLIVSTVPIRV